MSFHHVGAVFHPGNGPTSIDQPVGDSASRTTRRLISVLSLAILFARQGVERGLGEVVLVPGPRRLADAVLGVFGETEVWVPALWSVEVANVLLVAERRGRLTSAGSARFLELLGELPIIVDGGTHERAFGSILSKGRELSVSAYDATYVDLAIRLGALLATRDRSLKRACEEYGVEVFQKQ